MIRSKSSNKRGQAMVEFLLGIVGIVFILLGLELISNMVTDDFDSMINVREKVAEAMVNGTTESTSGLSQSDSSSAEFYTEMLRGIKYSSFEGIEATSRYPNINGFDAVAAGNPLSEMAGQVETVAVPVESTMLQTLLGMNYIRKDNSVWMPPWDDLMGDSE